MSENEQEIKELLVQLELDLISEVDDSLVLGPNQYSTRERTFRGGTILNETEFKILPPDVVDFLHSVKRDQIIPEHERMRFDEPADNLAHKEDASASSEVYIKSKIFNEGQALNEVEFLKRFVELLELNLGSSGSIGNPEISYTVQVSNSPKKPANKMTLFMEDPVSSATRNHAVRDYLRSKIFNNQRPLTGVLDCVVDIGKAMVADLEPELKNQVFSAELINKINKERPWIGGVVVKDTDFSEKVDEFYDLEILTKEEIEIAQSKQYDFRLNEKEIKKLKM
ncbi:hypothetical protein [Pseudomonas ficuserectae]|uniref:hypothetical protein n=1 Tax=Pseudomonas ficuserectae TaxID=53410 RepID=UPI000EFE7B60|nr:hypothetical protein [Pseudomonas ficuserectae]